MLIILGIENPTSKAIYEQANKKSNKIMEMYYFTLVKVTFPAAFTAFNFDHLSLFHNG